MKVKQNFKILMTIIITALITFLITTLWMYGGTNEKSTSSLLGSAFKDDKISTKLELIKNKISEDFIGEIDEEELMEYAIKGYVAGLEDKYSEYYTPEEMDEYYSDTVGEYVGIGVYITLDTEKNAIVVYDTIENSPAREIGLKAGDVITEVDGVSCNGDDYDTITDKIKGKIGTKVNIKVKRTSEDNKEETLSFDVERKNIEIIRVTSQMLENNIGYIYISSFDGTKVSDQFESQYDKLVEQGAKSLIIDVRSNGGGIVDEALEIADLLTNKNETLLIESNKGNEEKTFKSTRDKKINMNVVLLTNEYSASASEILAGIVKDLVSNAKIVGEKTFGKGVIQTLYQLTDGSGLKLTTEQYFTPKHNEINGKGIEPDIVVDDYSFNGTLDEKNDTQLQKAIEILNK